MEKNLGNEKFNRIYFSLWGILIVVAILSFIFYKFGYRLNERLAPVKVGAIELTSNTDGLQVFIDNKVRNPAKNKTAFVFNKIIPGLHSVVVSKDGYWPWTKTIDVKADETKKIYAFIFPIKNSSQTIIPNASDTYKSVAKKISAVKPPEPNLGRPDFSADQLMKKWIEENVPKAIISRDKTTALFVEDNTIFIAWVSETEPPPHYFCEENPCKFIIPVTVSAIPIKTVEFYKDRSDLVLFSAGTTIYGIETDKEGTQNFEPFYRGKDPYFFKADESTLYIKDGDTLSEVKL